MEGVFRYIATIELFKDQPLLLNFIDNTLLIHFIHRGMAYLLLILITVWTFQLNKINGSTIFNQVKNIPLLIVLVQVALGIGTVLFSKGIIPGNWGLFEWTAQLHQLTGMLLLLSLVMTLFLIQKEVGEIK